MTFIFLAQLIHWNPQIQVLIEGELFQCLFISRKRGGTNRTLIDKNGKKRTACLLNYSKHYFHYSWLCFITFTMKSINSVLIRPASIYVVKMFVFLGGGAKNYPVYPSISLFICLVSTTSPQRINAVALYDLGMCMKVDNLSPK